MKRVIKPSTQKGRNKPVETELPLEQKSPQKAAAKSRYPKAFPVVAFGASAGGIKAFTTVLRHLDAKLGMAYVLIMHLSPTHKSALAEIMQSKTSMPVHTVVDGMELKANNVFVIPPNTFMSVVDGHLKLATRSVTTMGNFAIDYFLTGLASLYRNNAIGVILSGTATDGTLGLKAIKAEGGITFAQDETAEFEGMPQSAIGSGYVDFTLPPHGIANELKWLTKAPYTNLPSDKIDIVSLKEINGQAADLKRILTLVRNKTGVDFHLHYKQASIYRRVMRRMVLNKFEKLRDYGLMLKSNPKEVDALFDDFLINVTNFFRDPDFYRTLATEIFPAIIKTRKANDPIRIWVAGCATGEEAYSIAICLTEFLNKVKLAIPIQIFASDLDAGAIEKARQGIYPISAMHRVSPTLLAEYFSKIDGHFQVVKSIRQVCIFSQHNLLNDPPFSRMNLISCQNVLIYLEANPQRKILHTFHYAIEPTGYLFLGKSETVGNSSDLFKAMDKKIRYYSRKNDPSRYLEFTVQTSGKKDVEGIHLPEERDVADLEKEMGKVMLSRFVYPGVVVNKSLVIVQFFGVTSPYLAPATGKASFNILKMIREDLVIDVRTLLQRARQTEKVASKEGITIHNRNTSQELTIEVVPKKTSAGTFFLVVFKERAVMALSTHRRDKLGGKQRTIAKLETELVESLEVIRTITEEYETTYEELQANNEEILSSNEELQSVNEELETSKEELQSSNEELTTINEESCKKNVELRESHEYTDAIVETMHGPLLVLTSNLQVRKANAAFYHTFQLLPDETEGNFLYDLSDGSWNIPELRENLKDITPGGSSFRSFEVKHTFKGLGERDLVINVYRLPKGKTAREDLVLLAFDDFTRRYSAETSLLKSQEQLKLSLVGDSIGTWWWTLQSGEIKWSKENERLHGLEEGSFGGAYADWQNLIHRADIPSVKSSIQTSMEKTAGRSTSHSPVEMEYRITLPDKTVHWIFAKGHVYFDQNDQPERMVGVSMDTTEKKAVWDYMQQQVEIRTAELTRANKELRSANQQLEQFVFISSHDLQEPIRKIQTFVNILNDERADLNAFSKKYMEKINASASRMSALLTDIHSFSTLKHDSSKLQNVDLNDLLNNVLRHFEDPIASMKVKIKISHLPTIHGDPDQMTKLFSHLIDNALKFSRADPVIEVSSNAVTEEGYALYPSLIKDKSYLSIIIKDNGIGFEQRYADKIFVLFQQLRDVSVTGTGIGLAICKKIIENHGGFITATGKLSGGATFTLFLPVQ